MPKNVKEAYDKMHEYFKEEREREKCRTTGNMEK